MMVGHIILVFIAVCLVAVVFYWAITRIDVALIAKSDRNFKKIMADIEKMTAVEIKAFKLDESKSQIFFVNETYLSRKKQTGAVVEIWVTQRWSNYLALREYKSFSAPKIWMSQDDFNEQYEILETSIGQV